eukprot:10168087-Prorocentrum_lima.AAC.1
MILSRFVRKPGHPVETPAVVMTNTQVKAAATPFVPPPPPQPPPPLAPAQPSASPAADAFGSAAG